MNELEIAHCLRTMAAEHDDIVNEMRRHTHKSSAWQERAEELADHAVSSRQMAEHIEQSNAHIPNP